MEMRTLSVKAPVKKKSNGKDGIYIRPVQQTLQLLNMSPGRVLDTNAPRELICKYIDFITHLSVTTN